MFYEVESQLQVHGYTNVNWVGNVSDKKSTNGFMFFLEMVLLVGLIRNKQHLHYLTQR